MQSCASCPLEAMKDFTKADVFHILFYLLKMSVSAGQRGGWASGNLWAVLRGGVGDSSSFPQPGLSLAFPHPQPRACF